MTDTPFQKANSPDEVLDLVDMTDTVVGTTPRPEANNDPALTHREISVLLFDSQKRVVIQKRSRYKEVHPNMWSLLAGHVPAGEDPEKVAYQELQEEYGIDNISLQYVTKQYIEYPHESHFMYYFVGAYSGEVIHFEASEISEVRVVSEDQLQKMIQNKESFNTKYLPILAEFWQGKYATYL